MRSKYRRRQSPSPQGRSRTGGRTSPILVGLVLVVFGAALALTVERLIPNTPGPTARATAAPLSPSPLVSSPSASAQAAASIAPTALPSPAAPVLEAQMPRTINGTVLTIKSAINAASLGGDPSSRALSAAMSSLGKKPDDLEIAEAYDPAGALALTILAFRVAGIDAAKLRSVVLEAWLSTRTAGVVSSSVTLAGTPSTRVSYGDAGPSDYAFVRGDSVFVVVTADQALAVSAAAAIAAPSSSAPPVASPAASAAPSGS